MKKELISFLLEARTKTYAGSEGYVKPLFKDSKQLEYKKGKWFYRDIYYVGPKSFMGLETIYYQNKSIFSMSYFGNFKGITENELDKILRKALIKNWQKARIWKRVEWKEEEYKYICLPDFKGSINEFAGLEKISKKDRDIYTFFYGGGTLIKI